MSKTVYEFTQLPFNQLKSLIPKHTPFILLDSASRSSRNSHLSYLFLEPVKEIVATEYADVKDAIRLLGEASSSFWIAGFCSYEAVYGFETSLKGCVEKGKPEMPLVWFGLFEKPWIFDHRKGEWNKALPGNNGTTFDEENVHSQPVEVITRDTVSQQEYVSALNAIHDHIYKGNTYQVNYTYNVDVSSHVEAIDLYLSLRTMQNTAYCAFIKTRYGEVLCFSPELFFQTRNKKIETKPMKGTMPRGVMLQEDRENKLFLQTDEKNRAENLMIVDLIRNDLGRICTPGSIRVPKLFEIETHPTVFQMTSSITGLLRKEITLSDIILNIFPCGSVTGAPKISTMQIIRDLEIGCRGIYCGLIGYSSPQSKATFTVPIRTLQKPSKQSVWQYRVGGGIVWDSKPEQEWQECHDKYAFLQRSMQEFAIIETIGFYNSLHYAKEHMQRMMNSANYFDFPFSEKKFYRICKESTANLARNTWYRIRVTLNRRGEFEWQVSLFEKDKSNQINPAIYIVLVERTVNFHEPFLYHKTSYRPWYAQKTDAHCFDTVYFDSNNRICEGSRTNVFIEIDSLLYTPPVELGILPGILRNELIKSGRCHERIITCDELQHAECVYCGNSVRGLIRVLVKTPE